MSLLPSLRRRIVADPHAGMTPEHRAFCLARQEMHRAFMTWLATNPAPELVRTEMASDVLRQIYIMERGDDAGR